MIIVPSFQGKHDYEQYNNMKNQLRHILKTENDIIIDISFVFHNELYTYVNDILCKVLLELPKKIVVQSTKKPELRKCMKTLRRNIITYNEIYMNNGLYRFEVNER